MTLRLALFAVAALAAGPAGACSVEQGYRVPTSLELAAAADTIVIARIDGGTRGATSMESAALATPTALLKGARLPTRIIIPGATIVADPRVLVTRSAPRELREPNRDALSGGCVRYAFRPGMQLVLFLTRGKGGMLTPYRAPFARDAEDVAGPGALWVKAVREYAAISKLAPGLRRAALQRRIAGLRAAGDADARAIADDMAIELRRRR